MLIIALATSVVRRESVGAISIEVVVGSRTVGSSATIRIDGIER